MAQIYETDEVIERVLLIGVALDDNDEAESSLDELAELAKTAGAVTVGRLIQPREYFHPATYIGKGKLEEVRLMADELDATGIICDDELTPAQLRNLEDVLNLKIMDRTMVILDIFASRANTSEGKIQVEMAQLKYRMTRLSGLGTALSRLGGGIGTRGPGEKKIETDRRLIRDRISKLSVDLKDMKEHRDVQRSKRAKTSTPVAAIVGYTNAGKSTLLNTLTNSDIYAKDQLFATLDPTTRQLTLPNKQEIIITDTVGFIQRLPHQLIAAFRSTLEVVTEADLLVHVIDVSHELYKEQAAAVHEVLKEIGAETKPVITVYNKIDKLPPDSKLADRLALEEDTVCISAAKKLNLETLQQMIESHLKSKAVEVTLCIPYAETAKAAQLHETANVLEQEYTENGAVMKVILPVEDLEAYNEYILKSE